MGRSIWFGVTLVIAASCVGLGFWQLDRRAQRLERNAEATAGRSLPPLDLNLAGGEVQAQRRVVVRGEFDHDAELILRSHLWMGAPGIHVVTPLRLAGTDRAILVNRGFVPSADAATPDEPVPVEAGEVVLEGIVVPVPATGDGGQPAERDGRVSWRRLDLPTLRERLGYPLLAVYLLPETPNPAGPWPRRVEWPGLDQGPHLSYALQWFGIAAAVLAFGVIFVLGVGRAQAAEQVVPPPPSTMS
ncbi:MAG TPA: SURF1 family protein [Gemmatimonadales bacterium]|nr:SURF1 family protein [Gemmatimonadales bacterium]